MQALFTYFPRKLKNLFSNCGNLLLYCLFVHDMMVDNSLSLCLILQMDKACDFSNKGLLIKQMIKKLNKLRWLLVAVRWWASQTDFIHLVAV